MTIPACAEMFGRAFESDPHRVYADMRKENPVRLVTLPGGMAAWIITRYEHARQALADPRLSKATAPASGELGRLPEALRAASLRHMLAADPPEHARLRRLVSAAFTPRRIQALRPRIQQITDGLLEAMAGRDEVDLIDGLAFPLPIQVICELLGVPAEDRDRFRDWTEVIVSGAATRDRLPEAMADFIAYLRRLIARKRAEPADDLVSALTTVHDGDDQLSEDELSSMVFLLLAAGHETTATLIGNAAYLLLTHPDQARRLRAEPALLPAAIEEILRYESPVATSTFRVTAEAVEIGGQSIPAGQPVLIALLGANRDPARFAGADALDLARDDAPHLAFGHGIHYCLGAPLARLEAHIAIGTLLARYPGARLAVPAEQLTWRPGLLIHALTALPVHPA
jgi:cytochrome P450